MSLLKLEALTKRFGDNWALKGIDFSLAEGEIVSLIGPNGAGKTTLFNLVSGRLKPSCGRVVFAGKDITRCKAPEICRLGISRTFQSSRPFAKMSVLDNVMVGCVFGQPFRLYSRPQDLHRAWRLLEVTGLVDKAQRPAGELSPNEQRRLDLARALASRPRLLLLDEVAAGFSPLAVKEAVELVRRVRQQGITLLIIDHLLNLSLRVADRVLALDGGEKIAEGPPPEVMRSPEVLEAYVGTHSEDNGW